MKNVAGPLHVLLALPLMVLYVTLIMGCERADEAASANSGETARKAGGSATNAKSVYVERCLTCHGTTGAGDGSMVAMLKTKPRSFDADEWRFVDFTATEQDVRTTIAGVISDGVPDAMMPGYSDSLSEAQIDDLVDYVLELRRRGRDGTGEQP